MSGPTGRVLVPHQPAYLPYPGYFSRLLDGSRLLLLDSVQFARGWQQRQYVRSPGDVRQLLTVPVYQKHGQPIHDVRIAGDQWRHRHWRTLNHAYGRAPYWPDWEPALAAIYKQQWRALAELNLALTRLLLEGFGIEAEITTSRELNPVGAKTSLLVDLCRRTDSTVLRLGSGALAYLDIDLVTSAGITVQIATYQQPSPPPSGRAVGLAGLSALDLLLHRGPQARQVLAEGARLAPWPLPEAVAKR
jgi:hypothetical protein